MNTTQQHLSIADIQNDILLLKNGGGALILQVSAVNFGLLSDREQVAIITAFAQTLNSLSFSIQIIIHSERLDISSYLKVLDIAQKAQTNPLLSQMITEYRRFIQATIKENEVLDKRFYIVIPLFSLELGLTASKTSLEQKIKTVLIPRRDQIIRQLGRVGLRATQLSKQKMIEVFYDIYNGQTEERANTQAVNPQELAVKLKNPQPIQKTQNYSEDQNIRTPENKQSLRSNDLQTSGISEAPTIRPPDTLKPAESFRNTRTHPFVVEELEE